MILKAIFLIMFLSPICLGTDINIGLTIPDTKVSKVISAFEDFDELPLVQQKIYFKRLDKETDKQFIERCLKEIISKRVYDLDLKNDSIRYNNAINNVPVPSANIDSVTR